MCGNSSIGRATAFQAVGCEFDPRFPLQKKLNAGVAQLVEQLICNQQVVGSNPIAGSRNSLFLFCFIIILQNK